MASARKRHALANAARRGKRSLISARASWLAGNLPLELGEPFSPFFIIGSGRSGNTLVRRILNNHYELYIPPETYILGQSIWEYAAMPWLGWDKLVSSIYLNLYRHPQFSTFGIENLDKLIVEVQAVERAHRSLALIFNRFYEYYRKIHHIESRRWGDKTPLNTFFLSELSMVFPSAKFIHLVRNPYDVVASYLQARIYDNVEDAAFRWLDAVESARKHGSLNRQYFLEVSYESLVRQPDEIVSAICKFLEIDFYEEILTSKNSDNFLGDVDLLSHHAAVRQEVFVNSIGKGLQTLSRADVAKVNRVIGTSRYADAHYV